MGELSEAQRAKALALVSSALSRRGFEKVQQIMDGDEVLKTNERNNPIFGKDLFFLSILGTPSEKKPWMLQFGGHHLALNVTIAGGDSEYRVADLVLGPGQDGKRIEPEGLKASAMNDEQRAMLLDLISKWAGIVHDQAAAARIAEIKAGLGETWFAWSGPTTCPPGRNGTAYYSIQGPNLVIEYAPQKLGGDPSMHIHTICRDPNNDYGRNLTTK